MTRDSRKLHKFRPGRLQLATAAFLTAMTAASAAHAVPVAVVAAMLPASWAVAATAITFVVNTAITTVAANVGAKVFGPKQRAQP